MRQSENLPEVPIQKFTGFHNPEYKKKRYNLYRHTFVFVQLCGGAVRKMWGCRKKLPSSDIDKNAKRIRVFN